MALTAGTRLGPYEILSALGAGGMGEVYKARDTRLGRTVAVKVLRPDAAADTAARARFEREARAIAALSHPHICIVHDVGRHDDTDYLVMELLEGETLADRLARTGGPLPLDQVLAIGTAIADALDKAHRAGIVHRDLKPANVMLTKAGPKLLDFGLAKLHGAVSPVAMSGAGSDAPTAGPGTAKGTILGTIHYMAPEQVEGRDADARSDIWALGAVLYEMATGQRPFDGDSAASIVGAILKDTPPALSARQPLTPQALERLVKKCLMKDPDERWQSAKDLHDELRWISDVGSNGAATTSAASSRAHRPRLIWALMAAVILIAAIVSAMYLREAAPAQSVAWLSVPPPFGHFGNHVEPAISPDGTKVAFFAPDADGVTRLWVRALDAPTARALPGTEDFNDGSGHPAWSPDGRALAFFAQSKLQRVDVAGGAPQPLVEVSSTPHGASWGAQGVILYVPTPGAGVYRISAAGGAPARVDVGRLSVAAEYPEFLPDGQHFLFNTQPAQIADEQDLGIYAADTDAPGAVRVLSVRSRAEYARGHLFFGQQGSLFAQPFDVRRLEATGEPFRVAEGLGSGGVALSNFAFSISDRGTPVYANTSYMPTSQLTWMDRAGRQLATIGEPGMYFGLALSPDDSRVAVDRSDTKNMSNEIWLIDTANGGASRLTRGALPIWAPALGDRLLSRAYGGSLAVIDVRTARAEALAIPGATGRPWPTDWSPDGRSILFKVDDVKTLADIWTMPMDGGAQATPYLRSPSNEMAAHFSPDGRWVAYSSDESGRSEVFVQSFPVPGAKVRISPAGGSLPTWARDGRKLYYLTPTQQLAVAALTPTALGFSVSPPQNLFRMPALNAANAVNQHRRQFEVSRDEQRFLVNALVPETTPATVTILLNWTPPK